MSSALRSHTAFQWVARWECSAPLVLSLAEVKPQHVQFFFLVLWFLGLESVHELEQTIWWGHLPKTEVAESCDRRCDERRTFLWHDGIWNEKRASNHVVCQFLIMSNHVGVTNCGDYSLSVCWLKWWCLNQNKRNLTHINNAMTWCRWSPDDDYSFVVSPAVGEEGKI